MSAIKTVNDLLFRVDGRIPVVIMDKTGRVLVQDQSRFIYVINELSSKKINKQSKKNII
mgnify:CR=1 FL=1